MIQTLFAENISVDLANLTFLFLRWGGNEGQTILVVTKDTKYKIKIQYPYRCSVILFRNLSILRFEASNKERPRVKQKLCFRFGSDNNENISCGWEILLPKLYNNEISGTFVVRVDCLRGCCGLGKSLLHPLGFHPHLEHNRADYSRCKRWG